MFPGDFEEPLPASALLDDAAPASGPLTTSLPRIVLLPPLGLVGVEC